MPADQMYRMLMKSLRDADQSPEGREFIRRFLAGPQSQADVTGDRIRSLALTDSPATCRADLLRYLKDHVGLTRELDHITQRLSDDALRKLIALAVPMWRQKGTDQGVTGMAQLLTGRSPGLDDWFHYRFLLGENHIGVDGGEADGWLIGGEASELDEYLSHMRVMDDGILDEQLLLDLLQLSRPGGERIEVALVDFLDRFEGPKDRWTALGAAQAVIDSSALDFHLPPGAQEQASITVLPAESRTEPAFSHRFMLAGATSRHAVRWNVTPAGWYYELDIGTDIAHLRRFSGGAGAVTLATLVPNRLTRAPGAWYGLRVETYRKPPGGTDDYVVRVFIDGDKVVEMRDSDGYTKVPAGEFQLLNPSAPGAGDNRVDSVEVWRYPLRFASIGPAGVTMTPNFIQ